MWDKPPHAEILINDQSLCKKNITGTEDKPDLIEFEYELEEEKSYNLTNGPGKLSQALGITKKFNGHSLYGDDIWIEDIKISLKKNNILSSPRIGVDYAGTDAKLPYRFYIKNNKWVS